MPISRQDMDEVERLLWGAMGAPEPVPWETADDGPRLLLETDGQVRGVRDFLTEKGWVVIPVTVESGARTPSLVLVSRPPTPSGPRHGGAAFPSPVVPDWHDGNEGMTLRDFFAGKSIEGAVPGFPSGASALDEEDAQKIASAAYRVADAMLVVRVAALLLVTLLPGVARAQGAWQQWGPEYQVPESAAAPARAADALVERQWPSAPMRLLEWIRHSMTRSGSIPQTGVNKPLMDARHLRPLLGAPQSRECYWHYALAASLRGLANVIPTAAGHAELLRLAAMVQDRVPDHCKGPSGKLAAQAWSEEVTRYRDILDSSAYQRLVHEARPRVQPSARYTAGEALGRCTEIGCVDWTAGKVEPTAQELRVLTLLVAVALFPPAVAEDAPLVQQLLVRAVP